MCGGAGRCVTALFPPQGPTVYDVVLHLVDDGGPEPLTTEIILTINVVDINDP